MSEETPGRPPTPLAIKVGLVLCGLSILWWFLYYAQYGGPLGLMGLKLVCIAGATRECAFFQQQLAGTSRIPAYLPVLWYAGLAALAAGVFQTWRQRRK